MAGPADFAKIQVSAGARAGARASYEDMGDRALAGEFGWAGFAMELAIAEASDLAMAPTLRWDLEMQQGDQLLRIEVKTRVATEGWDHPDRFDWVVVPTHDGREPIKPEADLVMFAWYSVSVGSHGWVLGYLRGAEEFRRRAVFYGPDEPLPRGGWAGEGGAYCIDVTNLRPVPRGMFEEVD